ncbi:MAG TPA: LysR substrate-binding domain-containing protein [Xanthobacteraceae bacterium]|nr:LysR substrate-binding domain-containing protein [Xanthobacteraceae bacterium]
MPDDPLPPLNAVRAFAAAAHHASFVEAARELNVTHWAVGKQIRLLEDWLGVALFERRPRGVTLTDEGAELLTDVSAALARLASAARKLRRPEVAPRVSGVVRVNSLSSLALRWLLPRLPDFQKAFPNVEVRLSTTSRKLRYVGSAFDVGLRSGGERGAAMHCETLMPDRRLPACSPDILRRVPLTAARDLRGHVLLHSTTTRAAWPQWLAAAGVADLAPAGHVELDHVYLQLQAAVDGLGVALASLPLIEGDIAAGRLVCPIAAPELRADDYQLIVSRDRARDAAVRAFRMWVLAAGKESARPRREPRR